MKIRPLNARVIVRPLPMEEISAGGIVIPDVARERKDQALVGEVVGVGPGWPTGNTISVLIRPGVVGDAEWREYIPLDVKVGDRVLFGNYVGEEIMLDGVKHHHLHELHILAVIEEA